MGPGLGLTLMVNSIANFSYGNWLTTKAQFFAQSCNIFHRIEMVKNKPVMATDSFAALGT